MSLSDRNLTLHPKLVKPTIFKIPRNSLIPRHIHFALR